MKPTNQASLCEFEVAGLASGAGRLGGLPFAITAVPASMTEVIIDVMRNATSGRSACRSLASGSGTSGSGVPASVVSPPLGVFTRSM